MKAEIEPTGDLVQQWLATRMAESDFDLDILSLIEKHRKGAKLDEASLLAALVALSKETEDKNDSH